MSAFTRQQQDILTTVAWLNTLLAQMAACQWVRPAQFRIDAIKAILLRKGVSTEEEFAHAVKEAEAARAVDETFNPELQAAYAELNRVIKVGALKKKRRQRKSGTSRGSR